MWRGLVLIGVLCGTSAAGSALAGQSARDAMTREREADASIPVPLETDLPADLRERIQQPIRLPAERGAEFYIRALGDVLARLEAADDDRSTFLRRLVEGATGQPPPEPVSRIQLRQDAAKLARVRLRKTADQRKAGRESFDAFRDMLSHPEFYEGRPFTVWGQIRRLTPLPLNAVGEAGAAALYEARLEPDSNPARSVLLVLTDLPEGFPQGDPLEEAVSVTGYVFRAEAPAGEHRPEDWVPLVVAATLTWHQAALSPEVRAALIASIRHRTPHRLEEVDDFYGLLRHAQLVDYADQKQAARRFLYERIEQFPADSRADFNHRIRQIAAEREANPGLAAEWKRREQQTKNLRAHEQRQYATFRDDPAQFPTFAHLFRSIESSEPHRYTGRLVTLAGHVRKHVSYPADPENEYGVAWLHEVWLYPDDSDSNPVVIVCSAVPDRLPTGENLNERAAVTGYFFKMWAYPARDTTRVAPMILAQRIEWFPQAAAAGPPQWLIVSVWLAAGLLAVAILWAAWSWSGRGRGLREKYLRHPQDEPPDFSRVS